MRTQDVKHDFLKEIRKMLKGMSSNDVLSTFGSAMQLAFEKGRRGTPPIAYTTKSGVLKQAALEGYAQYTHERDLRFRIKAAKFLQGCK